MTDQSQSIPATQLSLNLESAKQQSETHPYDNVDLRQTSLPADDDRPTERLHKQTPSATASKTALNLTTNAVATTPAATSTMEPGRLSMPTPDAIKQAGKRSVGAVSSHGGSKFKGGSSNYTRKTMLKVMDPNAQPLSFSRNRSIAHSDDDEDEEQAHGPVTIENRSDLTVKHRTVVIKSVNEPEQEMRRRIARQSELI